MNEKLLSILDLFGEVLSSQAELSELLKEYSKEAITDGDDLLDVLESVKFKMESDVRILDSSLKNFYNVNKLIKIRL